MERLARCARAPRGGRGRAAVSGVRQLRSIRQLRRARRTVSAAGGGDVSGAMTPEHAVWETRLLAVVTATLVVFGIAAVYGASSLLAVQRGEPGAAFALRQATGVVLGGILFLIAARVDYHRWERWAWPLIGLSAPLLLAPPRPVARSRAPEINGARRWIDLGFFNFQPSEVTKLAVVAWTAMLAAKKGDLVREFKGGGLA